MDSQRQYAPVSFAAEQAVEKTWCLHSDGSMQFAAKQAVEKNF